MPRNASGSYSLPAGNPVVTQTTIASSWANTTLDDLKVEMTDSLSRSAKGGMLGALALVDGTAALPALAFNTELTTGLFRPAANMLAVSVAGVERLRLTTVSPHVKFTSALLAADAGVDFLLDTTNVRTAGTLFAVQTGGVSAFSVLNGASGPSLVLNFGSSTQNIRNGAANSSLIIKGNRDAADAGTDIILDTQATRTAGNLLDIRNNGVSKLNLTTLNIQTALGFQLSTAPGNVQAIATNASLNLQGNRSAADAGTDLVLKSTVTRTAGNLLDVQNNTASRFSMAFDGAITLPNLATVTATLANTGFILKGNRNAADAGTDFVLNTTATRTAGNLLEVQNNGAARMLVTSAGAVRSDATELTTATAGTGWSLSTNRVRRSAHVVTIEILAIAGGTSLFTDIGTVPAGFQPPNNMAGIFAEVVDISASLTFAGEVQITNTGAIALLRYDNGTSLVAPFAIGLNDSVDFVVTYALD